ncbi:WG repeat-containing protein [Bariatricus sp. HCP28S3_D3]|uniref:WG repeat-containing protein n=1 Tax=Bariatricus sp. HCP28S3_D3 TaxID=3438901 RepID=UPI003F894610
MKMIMSRFRNILKENILLLILLIGFEVVAFLLLWKCSMKEVLRKTKTAYDAEWDYLFNAETKMFGEQVVIRNEEAYLVDEYTGEVLAGPYAGIAGDDFEFSYGIARYITTDGLIGFIDDEGHEITPAIYTAASEFTEGTVLVTDQEGNQYEIDTDGWKIP